MKNYYLEEFIGLCILYPSVVDAAIGFQAFEADPMLFTSNSNMIKNVTEVLSILNQQDKMFSLFQQKISQITEDSRDWMWTALKSDLFCSFNAMLGYSEISKHMVKSLCILHSLLVCVIAVNGEAVVLNIHL